MCFRVALHSSLRLALVLFIGIALLPVPFISILVSALAQGQSPGHSQRTGPPPRPGKPEGTFPNIEDVQDESLIEREPPAPIPSTIRSQRNSGKPWDGRRVGDPEPARGVDHDGQTRRAHARRRLRAPVSMYEDQFIQNFFTLGLARSATYDETLYWNYQFRAAYNNSAEALKLAAIELGRTVFESAEYAARARSAHWYVYDLYKTYLMRDPDATGWANWETTVGTNGREYVRRGFEESTEFANLLANIVPSGTPSATATSLISARVEPRNQPGNVMLTRAAAWSVPLLSLPGRNGLDLGLALSYSSAVWTRSGPYLYFDEDNGFPSPGFRLGFPTVQRKVFDAQTGKKSYLLISGSGQRVELRQAGTSNSYEAADSSYLQITDNGSSLLLRDTNGTQMTLSDRNGEYRCASIKDRNGNYLTINYDALGHLTSIVDTLARVINFNYDTNANLISITQSWNGQTHQWVSFGWGTRTMQSSFSGAAVVGTANGTLYPVLTQVALNDTSYFTFDYTNSLQVSVLRKYFGGVERNATSFTYETPGSDVPRLLSTSVSAQNWTGINGVPAQVTTQYSVAGDGACVLTGPDGTIYKEYYGTGWQRGLTTLSEVWVGGVRQKWTTTAWTQDNTSVGYEVNPRVTETNVYDAGSNRRRTVIDYGPYAAYGLPYAVSEYAADGVSIIRQTFTDYNLGQAYLDRRLIGLVAWVHVTNGAQYQTKITYEYDDPARLHGVPVAATQHDVNYNLSFTARGNVTAVSRWDVNDINNAAKKLTSYTDYYNTGTPISTTDPAGHQNSISYADSFSDSVNRNTFAYPTTMTDADGFSSYVQYNFDLGATTRTQSPAPAGQSQGTIQTMTYNNLGQLERITTTNNGAYKRFWYGGDYTASFATVNNVADEAYAMQAFDGLGRVIVAVSNHPGSTGGYSFVNTVYNQMGRVAKVSNPTEVTSSWVPGGDDAAGIYYTQQTYDWKGRPLITTNPDGTTKEASYAGCGCAGGEVVTLTDEGTIDAGVAKRRQQKIYSDVLGRTVKTEMLNWQGGSVYSATVNSYNARDQLTQARQYAGAEGSGAYQDTTMTYDGYGRLKTKHLPQQSPGTVMTWDYFSDDTVQKITDARGATQNFSYNSRHLIRNISYTAPSGSGIGVPATTTVAYDNAGNRTLMTDGLGTVNFYYDQMSRMTSEIRHFDDLNAYPGAGNYTLSYQYNLANALTSLAEPSQWGGTVSYVYDTANQLTDVTGSGFGTTTQFVSSIQYRAWGAVKYAAYGDGSTLNVSYNNRLLTQRYQLSNMKPGGGPATIMGSQNMFYADGMVKYTQDLQDGNFDRAYNYDHAGRLKEALSGREARGLSVLPYPDNPFRQTYTYDVWNNMKRPFNRHWSANLPDDPTYTNNRRSDSTYDAEGNVLLRDYERKQHAYDAAGRQRHFLQQEWGLPDYAYEANTIDLTFDGDGRPGKRFENRHTEDYNEVPWNEPNTVYYVRSTVLGGAPVVEFMPVGYGTSENIYIGNQKIAERFSDSGSMQWRHVNPVTGCWLLSYPSGGGATTFRSELDPLGTEVGTGDPYVSYSSYQDMIGLESLYEERGNPFDPGGGCGTLDGLPISCSELRLRMQGGTVATQFEVPETRSTRAPALNARGAVTYTTVLTTVQQPVFDLGVGLYLTLFPRIKNAPVVPGTNNEGNYLDWDERVIQAPQGNEIALTGKQREMLRSDIKKLLEARKDCADFMTGLLFSVAENTGLPLYRQDFLTNPLNVFDAIALPPQPGYFLSPGQGASGYAKGGLRSTTAKVTLDVSMGTDSGGVITRGLLLLHENAHEAGSAGYLDRELAIAAFQTAWAQGYQNIPHLPTTADTAANSQYLTQMIFQACHPNQTKRFRR